MAWWSSLGRRSRRDGFTLIELIMVTVIIGILSSMAAPRFDEVREKAQIAQAIGDINAVAAELEEYMILNNGLPDDLAGIGRAGLVDPWGNPYEYLPLMGAGPGGGGGGGGKGGGGGGGGGQPRMDRFLVPINSDFDLYSMGPDGRSVAPLTAAQSADDVIRANDGGFIGVASEY